MIHDVNPESIQKLADQFLLSICECERNPTKLLAAIETWRTVRFGLAANNSDRQAS